MNINELIQSIPIEAHLNPLLLFGVILVAGGIGGWIAQKLHLPSILGNLAAGVLIGPYCLKIVHDHETVESLKPLSMFAIGLIMVSIGGHLSWRRIHNTWKRIIFIAVGEWLCTIVVVTYGIHLIFDKEFIESLLIGSLACSTAPATLIHISRETHAKGPFVKTLLSSVAVDNILSITTFIVILAMAVNSFNAGSKELISPWFQTSWMLIGSILIGLISGRITEIFVHKPHFHNFSTVFIAILVSMGLTAYLGMSPLLMALFFGIYLSNSSRIAEEQLNVLEPLEWMLYIAFFTLAGVTLHLDKIPHLGGLGIGFILLRLFGKTFGSLLGGLLSGASSRIWKHIPLGLIPQAGVAIALVVLLQTESAVPESIRTSISTLILAGVVINELIGPLTTKLAYKRAGELNKARPRLVEFLEEEFIRVNMKAEDKWDAIRQMCEFTIRTHKIDHISVDELYESVVEREKQMSTAIGKRAAIPHGEISNIPSIQGALGIFRDGVDFDAPDKKKVRIIMLIVTPPEHREQHLKVLSTLAATLSHPVLRSQILSANDGNTIWEVLEAEDTPNFNYFIED